MKRFLACVFASLSLIPILLRASEYAPSPGDQDDEPTLEEIIEQLDSEEYFEYGAFFDLSNFDFTYVGCPSDFES